MPQRLRRLGTASAAVSAGALVLVLAAPAGEAAAETCKKGTDPASTIENWKCNLGNLRKALTPTPTPTPKPTPTEQTKKPAAPKAPKKTKAPARSGRSSGSGGSGGSGSAPSGGAGGGASAMTGGEGLKPYDGKAPLPSSGLPGVLPTPEIAADPNAYRAAPGTAAMPQTRLISPVASSERDGDQMLWVAAAAGAAGAVAALNISVAGRSLRRSAAARRR
ncbi:hypothetical protein F8568_008680 [Actinomadura sp. LD22]|uniref:Uncharacterized protein n=1 Tax=Actinomadura physcomitrii TaxID=2650748 RepID=A0A6I4M361_9ACTN|nr:hypothetical protein [Actinomadura physcomitrii]MWA00448.1 hypothetical protein [Actinomadura physcomitrii]